MTIRLIYHAHGGDIELGSGGILEDDGWFTTVFIMLFSNRRANADDVLPDTNMDAQGWPGDSYFDYPIGSRLWLLSREKVLPGVLHRAKDYALEALAPLIEMKMAKSVEVEARTWYQPGSREPWLRLDARITKADDEVLPYGFSLRWEGQYAV
ncbi:phage GP46 family protein [Shewanella algae]|uniref:phage GP46 family protein n=1 Tax=Shewanella algae TaxID=38313 RepID=UPI001AADC34D|nr:phage GP46 family protein [Shewanella algae]MBO2656065.1 phage GP46 family protein [Shewanella algae]